jgi:aryl sulfotransferase
MTLARQLKPAERIYRGGRTTPERWATWEPRVGDILVCTPPKSGTTWTQSILTMLVNGGPDLPGKVPELSPWVDADLGVSAEEVRAALNRQTGRRVVKTHTPADGFPVWEGVTVVAVYRHPLDVFFSLLKHLANMRDLPADDPGLAPVAQSLALFRDADTNFEDFDRDCIASIALHHNKTALSGRLPDVKVFHYADMIRDGRRAVEQLAAAAGIEADATLVDRVAEATSFGAMKANAQNFAPVAGTGFWKSDAGFFDSASSRKWEGHLSSRDMALYDARMTELIPDDHARSWLENGSELP